MGRKVRVTYHAKREENQIKFGVSRGGPSVHLLSKEEQTGEAFLPGPDGVKGGEKAASNGRRFLGQEEAAVGLFSLKGEKGTKGFS